jgi:NAD(P)H-dependent flavin oxidoreductase YrpB (nitropropane dioxygenase family)
VFKTRVTKLLKIRYPILMGAMHRFLAVEMVGAIAEAGGMVFIPAAADMGLIYKIVPLEILDSESTLLANNLTAKSLTSTWLIKSALDWSLRKALRTWLDGRRLTKP